MKALLQLVSRGGLTPAASLLLVSTLPAQDRPGSFNPLEQAQAKLKEVLSVRQEVLAVALGLLK